MKVDFIASLKQALNGKLNALSGSTNGINCTVDSYGRILSLRSAEMPITKPNHVLAIRRAYIKHGHYYPTQLIILDHN